MRVLITGASGRLGSYLLARLRDVPHQVIAWSGTALGEHMGFPLQPVELADHFAVAAAITEASPDVVIHAGGISQAEAVHADAERGRAVITDATQQLADWAARHNRRLIFTSTDLVFDGRGAWYRETDLASPVTEYGRAKLAAESCVLAAPKGLVARIALLYGPSLSGRPGFFDRAMARMQTGQPQAFFIDEFRTPLDYATAAGILVRLVDSPATGLLHVGGPERLSRYDLMRRCRTGARHRRNPRAAQHASRRIISRASASRRLARFIPLAIPSARHASAPGRASTQKPASHGRSLITPSSIRRDLTQREHCVLRCMTSLQNLRIQSRFEQFSSSQSAARCV